MDERNCEQIASPRTSTSTKSTKTASVSPFVAPTWRCSLIYLVAFLDLFAVSMLSPLLRQQTLDLGSSYTAAGLIASIYGVCQMFSGPIVGDWSDRFGRNRVMAATLMLTSFGYFLSISSWIPLIYFSRVICGSFKHTQTLCKAYIADLKSINESKVPKNSKSAKEKSGDNFGIFMAISTCGFVLGPVAGGHLAERPNGFQVVAVSTALTFFTNAIIIQMLLPKLHRRKKDGQSHIATPRAAYGDTVKDNWDIFLLQFLVSLSIMVVRTNYVQYVQENFGMSIKWAAYLTSYQALLGVVGSALVSSSFMRFYKTNYLLMLHTTLLIGLGLFGVATTPSLTIYILSLTLINFATPFSRMANLTQLLERSKNPDHYGALMGTSQSVGSFCRFSSAFVSGIAQDYSRHGPEAISVACSVLAVLQIVLMY